MYIPPFTAIDEDQARAIVADVGAGWLTTAAPDGPRRKPAAGALAR